MKLQKTYTLVNNLGTKIINTEYLDGFQYSTPNTEPIRRALEEQDDATISATRAGNEEAFLPVEERPIAPGNPPAVAMLLSFFPTAEGYYDYENLRYIYQYKDHLGNIRVSFVKEGGSLKVMDTNDYYPFGLSFMKPTGGASQYDPLAVPYNYKYNGKELQETGMYDYGARFYMPDIGRWGVVDPLAEKYQSVSPYVYAANNPIFYTDPDGRDIVPYFVNRISYKGNQSGNFNRDGYNFKLYTTKGYFSKPMDAAMRKFVKSETGRAFLLQYMREGQSFYGIKATENGKLSDKNLNIFDIRNDNKVDRNYEWVMGYDGHIANGKTGIDEKTGDLNVYIGTAKMGNDRVDDLVETTAHEFGQHGTKHERYLKLLNSGHTEKLKQEQAKDFNNDHYESKNPNGAKVYNGIMDELNMTPEWKKEEK